MNVRPDDLSDVRARRRHGRIAKIERLLALRRITSHAADHDAINGLIRHLEQEHSVNGHDSPVGGELSGTGD